MPLSTADVPDPGPRSRRPPKAPAPPVAGPPPADPTPAPPAAAPPGPGPVLRRASEASDASVQHLVAVRHTAELAGDAAGALRATVRLAGLGYC